jgi:hypothetical protein
MKEGDIKYHVDYATRFVYPRKIGKFVDDKTVMVRHLHGASYWEVSISQLYHSEEEAWRQLASELRRDLHVAESFIKSIEVFDKVTESRMLDKLDNQNHGG